mmetsp:Transcript_20620/g.45146  ORF Transcript_20620/g.45146 Transcript_20620/m.45146 type:complete len:554 (-) Transcript_20620:169-1830(-)
MREKEKSLCRLAAQTCVGYARMSATVVIAVVVRICLDCFGLVLTRQEPRSVDFWFAHCAEVSGGFGTESTCVLAGSGLFLASLLGCSLFSWSCRGWIADPARNPYARRYSFTIALEASGWVPISVCVGKTNALVEWFMDVARDDLSQALLSSAISALLAVSCAWLTHFAMMHCGSVASQSKEGLGFRSFGKLLLLMSLYCFGWAVGWSSWKFVLALLDALEPRTSVHNTALAAVVLVIFLVLSICFYLRFGPEPIIPDPHLQKLCYSHGYSRSSRRSLISYAVYSCTVFIVMCCCDSTYGLLHLVANKVYLPVGPPSSFDVKLLVVLALVAAVVTILAAFCSAGITWTTEVDENTSMTVSRSVSDARLEMLVSRRSRFQLRGARELSLELQETRAVEEAQTDGGSPFVQAGDEAAGPQATCFVQEGINEDIEHLSVGQSISRTLCAAVLVYDVLGLIVCFQWGSFAFRSYGILFGGMASVHAVFYILSCFLYASVVIVSLMRLMLVYFPSEEELRELHADASPATSEPFLVLEANDLQRGDSGYERLTSPVAD